MNEDRAGRAGGGAAFFVSAVRALSRGLTVSGLSITYPERMNLEREVWRGAAQQYGANRAEKYGRWYRAWRTLQLIGIVLLIIGILYLFAHRP